MQDSPIPIGRKVVIAIFITAMMSLFGAAVVVANQGLQHRSTCEACR